MNLLKLQFGVSSTSVGFLFAVSVLGANFDQCRERVEGLLTQNGTIPLDINGTISSNILGFDPIYHGPLYGFDTTAAPRPLTLTMKGCEKLCGSDADLNDVMGAFQILTTWVLPAVALFSQLPYESLSKHKRRNLEAFLNWVGSPAAALATTIYNIYMIQRCKQASQDLIDPDLRPRATDAYFVLSCVNQYEFPRNTLDSDQRRIRNTALMQGTLWPLLLRGDGAGQLSETRWQRLQATTSNLAFQLRLQRRKAVWPLAVSILWFLVAFAISIVTAFADLGDNTKAHSLALGLLLSWLPVVVVMAIVDRNPVSSTRCQNLIERWLYNVDQLVNTEPGDQPDLWVRTTKTTSFSIGQFAGQGRRLRYCGVANAVLSKIADFEEPYLLVSKLNSDDDFEAKLTTRPWSWWSIWILSQILVTTAFATAFVVSFNTPTIGLGCRSLLYLIWFVLSSIAWAILGCRQEPNQLLRAVSWIANTFATCTLFLIMGLQTTNGLNRCICKSSVFATGYGGWMDFENGSFYHKAYHVQIYWGLATAFGFVFGVLPPIAWAIRRWSKSDSLWKTKENSLPADMQGLELNWLI